MIDLDDDDILIAEQLADLMAQRAARDAARSRHLSAADLARSADATKPKPGDLGYLSPADLARFRPIRDDREPT